MSPIVLNKLHYLDCQSGSKIIHPGLSSQTHSIHFGFLPPSLQFVFAFIFRALWNRILNQPHPPIFNCLITFYIPTELKRGLNTANDYELFIFWLKEFAALHMKWLNNSIKMHGEWKICCQIKCATSAVRCFIFSVFSKLHCKMCHMKCKEHDGMLWPWNPQSSSDIFMPL